MNGNKELRLEILPAIILLIGISFIPVVGGINWEESARNSTLKIAVLGDSAEIKESLTKSVNASNIYTSTDVNSDVLEQVNIIFINSSYLKNLLGTEDKEVIALKLDSLAHSGKTMIVLGSNPEILYEYVKPNSMVIDLNSGQQEILALGVMIFPDNTSSSRFMPGNISQVAGEMFIWAFETTQMGEKLAASNPVDSVSTVPITQEKKPQDTQEATPLTEDEKTKAIEVAKNDPKVKESLPADAELIAVEIPPFAGKNDRIYNVIFKHGEFHDIITVNLTSGNVENSVSIRGEYQPRVEDLPMPVFREDVIIYFKEMPESLDVFASRYGVKLIFAKQDIKLAAFETMPVGRPGQTSQGTLDFIEKASNDSYVEKAFRDEFMFIDAKKDYLPEPKVMYPEDMKDEYVPDEVIVGFWRFPPSLDEFASKYGGKLKNSGYADNILKSALFETSNITEFIKKVSTDPYVRYAEPNGIGHAWDVLENNTSAAANTPKAPGFEAIPAVGLLSFAVYMLKRRNEHG